MNQFTDGDLIAKYVEIRAWLKADDEASKKRREPYANGLEIIEAEMMRRMNERGANSISADGGTAYRTSVLSVRTADKLSFLDWVRDNALMYEMDVRPAKETIQTWMSEHDGHPPPGVDVQTVHKVNFRRA